MSSSMIRTRWAAVGAAVAVTLGAGGISLVAATSPSGAATFVPIDPCRVIDTRPDFQVGPRNTPLGADETHTVTAVGNAGECTDVPSGAAGVVLNVTAVDATLLTFLTIWATGATQPNASSLNPAPGQPPTPNAVTTGLDANGRFDIYNLQGAVHVLADIVGYYTDHTHDDRYYTKGQANDRYYTKSEADDLFGGSGGSNGEAAYTFVESDTGTGVVASVTVDTPTYGYVIVHATAHAQNLPGPISEPGRVGCSITTGTTYDLDHQMNTHELAPGDYGTLSGSRAFTISALPLTGERTYRLACVEDGDDADLRDIHLIAEFVPDSDARAIVLPFGAPENPGG